MVTRSRLGRTGVALAASALVMGACSAEPEASPPRAPETSPTLAAEPSSTPPAPPPSPSPTTAEERVAQERAASRAVRTLQRYLDAWGSDGPAAAGRFLVEEDRPASDVGMPRLVSGTVESYEVQRWEGAGELTLEVTMRLRFDGERYAWDQGPNQRFVTAYLNDGQPAYLLHFATSP